MTPTEIAKEFHDTYERLAPSFGYETRKDTKQFDPTSPNGRLMIAVCAEVAAKMVRESGAVEALDVAEGVLQAIYNNAPASVGDISLASDAAQCRAALAKLRAIGEGKA